MLYPLADREKHIQIFSLEIKKGFFGVYQQIYPTKTIDDFNEFISISLIKYAGDLNKIKDDISNFEANPLRIKKLSDIVVLIHEGCGLLFNALAFSKDTNHDMAWVYLMKANKVIGKLQVICELDTAVVEYINKNKNIVQSNGGKARAEKYAPLIEKIYQLASQYCKNRDSKFSRRRVVMAIKQDALRFAADNRIALSELQAEKTIDKWLSVMPGAEDMFAIKKTVCKQT